MQLAYYVKLFTVIIHVIYIINKLKVYLKSKDAHKHRFEIS